MALATWFKWARELGRNDSVLYSRCDDRVTRACVERGCGVGVGKVSGWVTSGVTPCIMRRGGSLFCVVAPLSPLSHPVVAVGKSPSDSLSSSPLPWGVVQVTERSFSSRFRGKLQGINGSSAARTKTGRSVRARASTTPALFLPHVASSGV